MRLLLKGLTIDDRTKKYIEKKLAGIEKLLKKPSAVEVEIDLDKKGKFRLEMMARDPYNNFRSEFTSESIESSTDEAVEQLKVQIIKTKEKRETLIKRGGRSIKKKATLDKDARF
jgi:ribosomal subunit interface protein